MAFVGDISIIRTGLLIRVLLSQTIPVTSEGTTIIRAILLGGTGCCPSTILPCGFPLNPPQYLSRSHQVMFVVRPKASQREGLGTVFASQQ